MDAYTFLLALLGILTAAAVSLLSLRVALARFQAKAARSRYMAQLARKSHASRRKKPVDDDEEDEEDDEEDDDPLAAMGSLGPMVLGLATQLGIDSGKVMAGDPAELQKVQAALSQLKPAGAAPQIGAGGWL